MTDDTTTGGPPAGWLYDSTTQQTRWWNGTRWTEHVQPRPPALPDAESQPPELASVTRASLRAGAGEAPPPTSANRARLQMRPIYWSNLARIRFWQFTLFGSFVIIIIPALLIPSGVVIVPLYIVIALLLANFWLRQQMACHACGKLLAVTKISGPAALCGRCGTPTDRALEQNTE